MSDAMVMMNLETPQQAAVESKGAAKAGAVKTQGPGERVRSFRKTMAEHTRHLKQRQRAEEPDGECAQIDACMAPAAQSGEQKLDISICSNTVIEELFAEIVGILEGFELLDYQKADGENALAMMLKQAVQEVRPKLEQQIMKILQAGSDVPQALTGNAGSAENKGVSLVEQFAGMLENSQLKELDQPVRQMIAKIVGELISSFESTNNFKLVLQTKQHGDIDPEDMGGVMLKAKTIVKPARAQDAQAKQPETDAGQSAKTQKTQGAFTQKGNPKEKTEAFHLVQDAPKAGPVRQAEGPKTAGAAEDPLMPKPVVKQNVARIVKTMTAELAEGKSEFEIQMKPEVLGKLNIRLTMENGEVKMLIKTEELGVKAMLFDQLPAMQEELRQKGITVTSAEVVYENQNFLQDERNPFERQNRGEDRRRGFAHGLKQSPAEQSMFYGAMAVPDIGMMGASVEYHA